MKYSAGSILTSVLIGIVVVVYFHKEIEQQAIRFYLPASLLFNQSFEGGNPLDSFHGIEVGASHSLTVVDRPGGGGKTSRFELRQNDPDVKGSRRAEVTVIKDETQKEMWYAFEAYFPAKDYVDEDNDEVINQWYQSGMGTPSAALRTKGGRLQLRVGNNADTREKIDLGPVVKDQWQSVVVHMVHSYGSDGLTEVWVNGKKIVSRKGGNMYDGPLPKWKMGVYKSRWASEKTTTDKRVLFYDNIRVSRNGVSFFK
ncbi:heparin lyase I family protein [Pontibacter sp. JH31]|uniref:Heparin lyase I family protein n=1 Tax=Pontibacter aquaedesilientis TaxID=2766980 RepID=A0ABR7XHG8_9BACT|nr:polysaccharide lyase [Pontibacter aquaedesilientis]MBD1397727.1 heparin lyase I family protein [Pontibacter aquaedesilientis]